VGRNGRRFPIVFFVRGGPALRVYQAPAADRGEKEKKKNAQSFSWERTMLKKKRRQVGFSISLKKERT